MDAIKSFFESITFNLSSTEKIFFGLMATGAILMFIGFAIWLFSKIGNGEGRIKKRLAQFLAGIGFIFFWVGTAMFMKSIVG